MKRRLILQCAAAMLWSSGLLAQAQKPARVGVLWSSDERSVKALQDALLSGLRDLGYVAGRNLLLDVRHARGQNSRFAALADELIALRPDVLIGIESVAIVLRSKTTTIPIVLLTSPDPVAAGLVRSLARPGTNVTGMAYRQDELIAKHIELLTEIVPRMSRIAFFNYAAAAGDPGARLAARYEEIARAAATRKGLTLIVVAARDAGGVRQAFAELERAKPEGIVVASTGPTYLLRHEIAGHANRLAIPSISSFPVAWLEAGGLFSYGPDFVQQYRYAAIFVDRILKGADPAQMPIERPATFQFLVNAKVARQIGLAIPSSVLLRADRVIE
jgi:putative ABC transport system substrate-binding protein